MSTKTVEDRLAFLEDMAATHCEGATLAIRLAGEMLVANRAFTVVLATLMAGVDREERARIRAAALMALEAAGGNAMAVGLVELLTVEPAERNPASPIPAVLQ